MGSVRVSTIFFMSLIAVANPIAVRPLHSQQLFSQLPAVEPAQSAFDVAPWIIEDATLRSVHFVDADQGWAVGDFGIILHTKDGGTNWLRQESGVRCKLLDVAFSSPSVGYAVGGWFEPDTGMSRGVLLRTDDGGQSWTLVPTELSQLERIWILPNGGLLVFGEWSTVNQGRVLFSSDRGVNWVSIDGRHIACAQFVEVDSQTIYIVDSQGIVHRTHAVEQPPMAVSVVGPIDALAVGDGKLIAMRRSAESEPVALASHDQARTWKPIQRPMDVAVNADQNLASGVPGVGPADRVTTGSFTAIPFNAGSLSPDGQAWFVGLSGKRIARISSDNTCAYFDARASLPLYDVQFIDNFRGWAVGAFGTILVTRDGGENWRQQRVTRQGIAEAQEKRAMMLGVANKPISLPWSAIAIQSLEAGHRVAMAISQDPVFSDSHCLTDPLRASSLKRSLDAASRIGAGEVVHWEPSTIEVLLQSYRPSVLVLGDDVSESDCERWLESAVRNNVVRVFKASESGRSDVTLTSSAILPVAAAITGDLWSSAMEIIEPHHPIKSQLRLQRRLEQSYANTYRTGLADGLPNSGSVRTVLDGRRRNLQVLQARSEEREMIERLFRESAHANLEELDRHLRLLLQQTTKANQLPLLRSVLMECQQRGDRPSLQLFVLGLAVAVEQHPNSSLGRWARVRYEAMNTSREWRPLLSQAAVWNKKDAGLLDTPTNSVPAYASPFERMEPGSSVSSQENPLGPPNSNVSAIMADQASMLAVGGGDPIDLSVSRVSTVSSELSMTQSLPPLPPHESPLYWKLHPAMLMWRASVLGEQIDGFDQLMLARLSESASSLAWGKLAATEATRPLFATSVGGVNPKTGRSNRPLLDGVLDESCWEPRAHATTGRSSSGEPGGANFSSEILANPDRSTENVDVRFAYDSEFLYVAVRAVFSESDSESTVGKRNRDDHLGDQPHVIVSIDTDRDLLTSYELSVDRMGRTRDTCDGFEDWQPTWYVATKFIDGVRTVEAAIRREHLTDLPPVRAEKWRVKAGIIPAGEPRFRPAMPNPSRWRDLIFD